MWQNPHYLTFISRTSMLCSSYLGFFRRLRIAHNLRVAWPCMVTTSHLPERTTQPHLTQDHCGVLPAEAYKESWISTSARYEWLWGSERYSSEGGEASRWWVSTRSIGRRGREKTCIAFLRVARRLTMRITRSYRSRRFMLDLDKRTTLLGVPSFLTLAFSLTFVFSHPSFSPYHRSCIYGYTYAWTLLSLLCL